MSNTVVLVTGGFDPIHSGHIAYFLSAKKLGDSLIVGLNSDEWLTRKKGKPFMTWDTKHQVTANPTRTAQGVGREGKLIAITQVFHTLSQAYHCFLYFGRVHAATRYIISQKSQMIWLNH